MTSKPVSLAFRDTQGWGVRVWRDTWSGDSFVTMTREAFADFQNQCAVFGIPLHDMTHEDA